MALSKEDIQKLINEKKIVIKPFDSALLEPAGITLRLSAHLLKPRFNGQVVDPALENSAPDYEEILMGEEGYVMAPDEFLLGCTLEAVTIPNNLLSQVDGRSTMGRIGLVPHQAAMAIWPGHGANAPRAITLELKNNGPYLIRLRTGLRIGNLVFHRLDTPSSEVYDASKSKYQHDGMRPGKPKFRKEIILPAK